MRVQPVRLKSSFIYLANAVNDLRANWRTLTILLAPLAMIAGLCLLPDAINLQHGLAERFSSGLHHVSWLPTQTPYAPAGAEVQPLFPGWMIYVLHRVVAVLALVANLVVLCALRRGQSPERQSGVGSEALTIWREAAHLTPAFIWVSILQWAVPLAALLILRIGVHTDDDWVYLLFYLIDLVLVGAIPVVFLELYFAGYALVFDGKHGFHALLCSRDLMRKRFFKVAMRIGVFVAAQWGYGSLAALAFFAANLILGPIAALTGYLWFMVLLVELAGVAVTFITGAFFVAAGLRLYQDLSEVAGVTTAQAALPAT